MYRPPPPQSNFDYNALQSPPFQPQDYSTFQQQQQQQQQHPGSPETLYQYPSPQPPFQQQQQLQPSPQGQEYLSAYQYTAQYSLQPQVDHEDLQDESQKRRYPARPPKRPNYRPTPLRWPFIVGQIVVVCVAIALIVYVRQTMPNSDSTAVIEQRDLSGREIEPQQQSPGVIRPRWVEVGVERAVEIRLPKPNPGPIPMPAPRPVFRLVGRNVTESSTPVVEVESSTTSSAPGGEATDDAGAGARKGKEAGGESNTSSTDGGVGSDTSSTIGGETDGGSSSTSSAPAGPTDAGKGSMSGKGDPDTTITSSAGETVSPDPGRRIGPITGTESDPGMSDMMGLPGPSSQSDEIGTIVLTANITQTITAPGTTFTTISSGSTTYFGTTTSFSEQTLPGDVTTIESVITLPPEPYPTLSYYPGDGEPSPSPSIATNPGTTYESFVVSPTTIILETTFSDDTTTFVSTTSIISEVSSATTVVVEPVTTTKFPPPPPPPKPSKTQAPDTPRVITKTFVSTKPGSVTTLPYVITSATKTEAVTSTILSTEAPSTYLQIGTTEITSYYTVTDRNNRQPEGDPTPITIEITQVHEGTTLTQVFVGAPKTIVTDVKEVETVVVTQGPQTLLTTYGGSPITTVVYVTPTALPINTGNRGPGLGAQSVVETTVGGTVQTFTGADGQTFTSLVGGTPTVVVVDVPQTSFSPITMTVVSNIGGTPTVVTTLEAQTLVTTIDGTPTTIVTQVPRTFTSFIGGTDTTLVITTQPTGTSAIPFTILTTGSERVSTIINTFAPSTIVTTVSGKLTTIVSTPSPSTFLSTIKPSTTRIVSITTPTPTGSSTNVVAETQKFVLTSADYFVGKFLPTILAVMLAIPLRVIDLNAKLYQPFYALAREGGALGGNAMTLHYGGWVGFVKPFATLWQGHPVPFITTLLVWGSALLPPLSSEALGLKLHGKCKITSSSGCAAALGVSRAPTHALVALLAFIATLLLVLLLFLRNWETGLHANPWSIAGIASLAVNRDVRVHTKSERKIKAATAEKRYGFGWFVNEHGNDEYGIILYDDAGQGLTHDPNGVGGIFGDGVESEGDGEWDGVYERGQKRRAGRRHVIPFIALSYVWRLAFTLFMMGLMAVILYYHLTLHTPTNFKLFMDSQTFGVRFFFAALGVVITFCWTAFFVSVAIIAPYQLMSHGSQPPQRSILLTRPTNGFYGVYAAIKEGNIFLLLAALMTILSEFLPILLANIPYNLTQTLETHVICARISIGILGAMILTMVGSLFVRWPHMPVDPRSVAGALYYVSGSRMLSDFHGASQMNPVERERFVREKGKMYFYGNLEFAGGQRMGVESVDRDGGEGLREVETAYVGNQI